MKAAIYLLLIFSFVLCPDISAEMEQDDLIRAQKGTYVDIYTPDGTTLLQPLQAVGIKSRHPGTLRLIDGEGKCYYSTSVQERVDVLTGGALGTQHIILLDPTGKLLDRLSFKLECRTSIEENTGVYNKLLNVLYHSMMGKRHRQASIVRYGNQHYHTFVTWLRDHVHVLKGMKYFYPELKSGIDLYARSQRTDGMIWDNYKHAYSKEEGSYWVQRFRYGDFIKIVPCDNMLFTRIPVENDVEYLFIEGIYYTWKATGDDAWMQGLLDNALKAVHYSHSDSLRWSEKYGLLKRGYTIDTWDFQNAEDADISTGRDLAPDPMVITWENTRFGIMFGDNTGMAAACEYLGEMLQYAGRLQEAEKVRQWGAGLKARIDSLAWNGNFYRHHVAEDDAIDRELGVDEARQVSLSNAYSINRTLLHDQVVQIIKTYQRIRKEMPVTSPGEFYTIYPPFEKGFGGHTSKWTYMNGGVTPIVAGELAHGAFEHGFEDYGVDILKRLLRLARETNNYLHCTYRGKLPEEPKRKFIRLDMREIANADFFGETREGVMGWMNEGINDLHTFPQGDQIFKGIPFDIIQPAENDRRACVGISSDKGYLREGSIAVNHRARSLYFLHTANNSYYAGRITLQYADGSTYSDEIGPGKIQNWWYPSDTRYEKGMPVMRVAWRGENAFSDRVGVMIYGLNNPNPDKLIRDIRFTAAENGTKWMVLGVTLSDYPVFFKPDRVSGGIPDNWGAAAVVYALVEGLAGIKDLGVTFNNARIAPRWSAADVDSAEVKIRYRASQGYVAYRYRCDENKIILLFTGNADENAVQILLPEGKQARAVFLDKKTVAFDTVDVENSVYVQLHSSDRGTHRLVIQLEDLM